MTENLQIIDERELFGKQFRIFGDYENPLFLAKDVAKWIDYAKTGSGAYNVSAMLALVDENEKLISTVLISEQNREMWFLTEDGLYEVLMLSRKPIAKQFKAKVKEILKDIRKHGMHLTDSVLNQLLEDPEPLGHMLIDYAKEKKRRLELEKQVEVLKPKASYYDIILNCKELVPITQIAKDYGRSAKWLNKFLNEKAIQYRLNKTWVLYQEYADKGYAASKTHDYPKSDGTFGAKMHTYWTQKGREFLYRLLKNEGILPLIEAPHILDTAIAGF